MSNDDSPFTGIIKKAYLQDWIDLHSAFVDELKLRIDDSGWTVRAVDSANVAMIDTSVGTEAFDHYEAGDIVVGVDLNRLDNMVDMADKDDLIDFRLDHETMKLEIQYGEVGFEMALIDPDSIRAEPELPDLDLLHDFNLARSSFDKAIEATGMVSDHVTFIYNPDFKTFVAEGQGDTDSANVEVNANDSEHLEVNDQTAGENAESIYSMNYMEDIAKGLPDGVSELRLRLGNEFPIKMYGDWIGGMAEFTIMVAPRIQSQ